MWHSCKRRLLHALAAAAARPPQHQPLSVQQLARNPLASQQAAFCLRPTPRGWCPRGLAAELRGVGGARGLSSAADALAWAQQAAALDWWLVLGGAALLVRGALLPLSAVTVRASAAFAQQQMRESLLTPKLSAGTPSVLTTLHSSPEARRNAALMVASPVAQTGAFFYAIHSVRQLVAARAPGLAEGGTLWFVDLTETGAGSLGMVFPAVIAANFLFNVSRTFGSDDARRAQESPLVLGMHWIKWTLQFIGVSSFVVACSQPQGVLVYWVSASSLAAMQTLALQVRMIGMAYINHRIRGAVRSVLIGGYACRRVRVPSGGSCRLVLA